MSSNERLSNEPLSWRKIALNDQRLKRAFALRQQSLIANRRGITNLLLRISDDDLRGSPLRCELRVFTCYISARRQDRQVLGRYTKEYWMGEKRKLLPARRLISI